MRGDNSRSDNVGENRVAIGRLIVTHVLGALTGPLAKRYARLVTLYELDPEQVGRAAQAVAVARLEPLAAIAGYELKFVVDRATRTPELQDAVEQLCRYAQTGTFRLRRVYFEGLLLAAARLYGFGIDQADFPELARVDISTPWGLAIVGAVARRQLEAGNHLSLRQLAVLGGVSPGRMRQIVTRGSLVAERTSGRSGRELRVSAAEALKWLDARNSPTVWRPATKDSDPQQDSDVDKGASAALS